MRESSSPSSPILLPPLSPKSREIYTSSVEDEADVARSMVIGVGDIGLQLQKTKVAGLDEEHQL